MFFTDLETGALEDKIKRDHYTQLVGACLVGSVLFFLYEIMYEGYQVPFLHIF